MPAEEILLPQRMFQRPLTAGAGRNSEHRNSLSLLYDVKRPATAIADLVASESAAGPFTDRPQSATHRPTSAWKDREKVKDKMMRQRRLTVGQYQDLEENAALRQEKHMSEDSEEALAKIEDKIDYDHLKDLFLRLQDAHAQGKTSLDLDEFKLVIKSCIGVASAKQENEQIESLFMKIDSESTGKISIDSFCTYMQLEYAEKQDLISRLRQVSFSLPPLQQTHQHREQVFKLCNVGNDRNILSVSQDGMMCFWTPSLELKRSKSVTAEQNVGRKPKWITDFVAMPDFQKFVLSTGDRELQFYEASTSEPYCQISSLETVPLKMDYSHESGGPERRTLLLFGDANGCIHIIIFQNAGQTLRTWKKSRTDGIATVTIEAVIHDPNTNYIRWQVHKDWVTELKYFSNIGQIISCSNHDDTALVIGCTVGSTDVTKALSENNPNSKKYAPVVSQALQAKERLPADKLEFRVYKGVKTFDFNKDLNILVTGGMDRTVRLFNPYIPSKPNGMLKGHNAPVCLVSISPSDKRIFSVSTDKMVKCWDIGDQACLITIRPKMHQIRGDLQAVLFSDSLKAVVMAADNKIASLQLRTRSRAQGDIPTSHRAPVTCCGYNKAFHHVVSCSESSTVKVWDLRTGQELFEYSRAHTVPDLGPVAITCMTFDETYRRLITGGRDGLLKIWNYNNGNCLKTLVPRKPGEVTSCMYVNINKTRKVIAVGWDRRVNLFLDSHADGNQYHATTRPEDPWPDDITNGHKEDILCVTMTRPNMLATSGYDGHVIIWNMISGRTLAHLTSPPIEGYVESSLDGDMSVNSLIFIQKRNLKKDAASLVCSGPRGMVHFWNVYRGGVLFGRFNAVGKHGVSITCMQLTDDDKYLFTADSFGAIRVWDVLEYCNNGPETESPGPPCEIVWRAHVERVTSMELVRDRRLVVSCSSDHTVRLWTMAGEYVGTFGQTELWDVNSPSSFAHPHVPYDVLVNPESVPDVAGESNIPLEERKTFYEVVMQDKGLDEEQLKQMVKVDVSDLVVTDEDIVKDLAEKPKRAGKRLRHERHQPSNGGAGPASGVLGDESSRSAALRWFDIEESPEKLDKPRFDQLVQHDFLSNLANQPQ